jgi:hypothetical protein
MAPKAASSSTSKTRGPWRFDVLIFSCVRQVQQLVMVTGRWLDSGQEQHPFVRSKLTIPSSRPADRQSTARSGSQGCRRECGGTGGAGAQRP